MAEMRRRARKVSARAFDPTYRGGRRGPSLLHDGMTSRERTALETYRDARAAMALIREAIEDCAPPGSVPRGEYLTPEFTAEAEALVRGIYAIGRAGRGRSSG
jgi:hypothetical protein